MNDMHRLQAKVLYELSNHPSRRFSDMMAVTGLTSDDFKFHLRKLVALGYVSKSEDGSYELTPVGKELANRFDYEARIPIRQPKITTATYVKRTNGETGETEYLFYQRLRQPFYHYWGVIGKPVLWGDSFEDTALRGLKENAGLGAALTLKGFYRQKDLSSEGDGVFDDKLFIVYEADWKGEEPLHSENAIPRWMTIDQITNQEKRFDSCVEMLKMLNTDSISFSAADTLYEPKEF